MTSMAMMNEPYPPYALNPECGWTVSRAGY